MFLQNYTVDGQLFEKHSLA
jgi:hypothetical protein